MGGAGEMGVCHQGTLLDDLASVPSSVVLLRVSKQCSCHLDGL